MPHADLAEKICHLPEAYERGTRSTAALVEASGILQAPQALAVTDIEQILREKPGLADDWFERGSDQRVAGGWGVESDRDFYLLKNFRTGAVTPVRDRFRACAEFIVNYVRTIRDVLVKYDDRPAAHRTRPVIDSR